MSSLTMKNAEKRATFPSFSKKGKENEKKLKPNLDAVILML